MAITFDRVNEKSKLKKVTLDPFEVLDLRKSEREY
jgi:hypothetical protein